MGRGGAAEMRLPLARAAAAGGGDVAVETRLLQGPGRAREDCGSGRVGVCDTLPPTWHIVDLGTRAEEEPPPSSGLSLPHSWIFAPALR